MADATTHVLGPGNAELRVLTEREGLASRAGHDLVLVVGRWEATLVLGDDAGLELTADSRSLEVKSASGGVKPLSDKDRREIVKNIDTKVLHGAPIAFRANTITDQPGEGMTAAGDRRSAARPADHLRAAAERRRRAQRPRGDHPDGLRRSSPTAA